VLQHLEAYPCKVMIEGGPGHQKVDSPPWVHSVQCMHLTTSAIASARIQDPGFVDTMVRWVASGPSLDSAWCICWHPL
jgi:hypothetical protein